MNKEQFIKKYQPIIDEIADKRIEELKKNLKQKVCYKTKSVDDVKLQLIESIKEWKINSLPNFVNALLERNSTVQWGKAFTALSNEKKYLTDLTKMVSKELKKTCVIETEMQLGNWKLAENVQTKFIEKLNEKSSYCIITVKEVRI